MSEFVPYADPERFFSRFEHAVILARYGHVAVFYPGSGENPVPRLGTLNDAYDDCSHIQNLEPETLEELGQHYESLNLQLPDTNG
jgi:hypothetical protein